MRMVQSHSEVEIKQSFEEDEKETWKGKQLRKGKGRWETGVVRKKGRAMGQGK